MEANREINLDRWSAPDAEANTTAYVGFYKIMHCSHARKPNREREEDI
jgi:hypothetical protein